LHEGVPIDRYPSTDRLSWALFGIVPAVVFRMVGATRTDIVGEHTFDGNTVIEERPMGVHHQLRFAAVGGNVGRAGQDVGGDLFREPAQHIRPGQSQEPCAWTTNGSRTEVLWTGNSVSAAAVQVPATIAGIPVDRLGRENVRLATRTTMRLVAGSAPRTIRRLFWSMFMTRWPDPLAVAGFGNER